MTQEDRQILLKDLCERVPYGVKINENTQGDFTVIGLTMERVFTTCETEGCHNDFPIECVKPYLFPLSSMTEEQYDELYIDSRVKNDSIDILDAPANDMDAIDWLNKNHFDYRGLIPMRLAIDATNLNIY